MTPTPSKEDFPWWLVVAGGIVLWLIFQVVTDATYTLVLKTLAKGLGITLFVTFVAFSGASLLGLLLALGSLSRFIVVRQVVRFYVEIIRGIPIIVLLLYVAFVFTPLIVAGLNKLGLPVQTRDFPLLTRAIIALVIAYAAFLSEVFRAGLQSVDIGQVEAAKSLGLKPWQRFRHVVFPQAFRTVLPPYGNDFVAMVKDSSLVSVLGVADVTQLGKVTAAGNFRYFETYNVVALIYLVLTISLSLLLRRLESDLRAKQK